MTTASRQETPTVLAFAPAATVTIPAAELLDGDVVFVTGRWQRLADVRRDPAGPVRARTTRGELFISDPAALFVAAACPACEQRIAATIADPNGGGPAVYTECGGEGEGGCDAWCDGDPAAEAAHGAVVDLITATR